MDSGFRTSSNALNLLLDASHPQQRTYAPCRGKRGISFAMRPFPAISGSSTYAEPHLNFRRASETTSFAVYSGKNDEGWWALLYPSRKAESFRLQKHPGSGQTSCCVRRAILLSVPQRREKADWLVPSSGH